ncbi:MAG TPA: sugar ABC transporter permease [Rubellimicrobium sp.]|nr:sugar ABC transporter permease [Rubellimicrobium sp.]
MTAAALPRETDAALLARIGPDAIASRERARGRRRLVTGLLFMAPALLLVAALLLWPVAYDVWLSLADWKKFAGWDEFAGVANYAKMGSNPFFGRALVNTMVWVVASVTLPVALGLGLALLLRDVRGEGLLKGILFLPRILAPTAVGVLWYHVYAPHGLLNAGLGLVAGREVDVGWLFQDGTITPAIIATFVWQTVGLVMVLLLLGLAAIPTDPLEAARIDGASPVQTFWHITLPLLAPTLLMVTILSVLAGFTVFDLLWVMGSSYPAQRTLSLTVYMYFEAFQKGAWSYGAAVAVVIGLVVLGVTWAQALLQARVDRLVR